MDYSVTDAKDMTTDKSECATKVSPSKDQKSLMPVGRRNQKKTLQWWLDPMKMVKRLVRA